MRAPALIAAPVDQFIEVTLRLCGSGHVRTFGDQQCLGDLPALAFAAHHIGRWNPDTVEELLGERRIAGHCADRPPGDAGGFEIDQEERDAGLALLAER